MDQKYCDGVEEITITSGIVRIDYFHYTTGPKDKNGRPPRELSHRVVLSPEAFVQSFTALEQVIKQLQGKGLIQRRGQAGEANAVAGAAGATAAGGGGARPGTPPPQAKAPAARTAPARKSPNF